MRKQVITPITPAQVSRKKAKLIPEAILNIFNEEIAKDFDGQSATVSQDQVVSRLVAKGFIRDEIFDNKWLDIEEAYKTAGWNVRYDKPGFNEEYQATFTFSKKRDK